MSILDNLKRFVQPYSDDDDYEEYDDDDVADEEDEEIAEPAPRSRRPSPFANASNSGTTESASATTSTSSNFNGQVLNMNSGKQEVVLFHAKSFDDAAKAADELVKKKAVILNMENVDKALTRRVVDFLSGSVYSLDGKVKKIAQSTYLFCPHNMNVSGDLENIQVEIDSYI